MGLAPVHSRRLLAHLRQLDAEPPARHPAGEVPRVGEDDGHVQRRCPWRRALLHGRGRPQPGGGNVGRLLLAPRHPARPADPELGEHAVPEAEGLPARRRRPDRHDADDVLAPGGGPSDDEPRLPLRWRRDWGHHVRARGQKPRDRVLGEVAPGDSSALRARAHHVLPRLGPLLASAEHLRRGALVLDQAGQQRDRLRRLGVAVRALPQPGVHRWLVHPRPPLHGVARGLQRLGLRLD
mmetsp:Transcript_7151/g.19218  ORF Transcript_7151/g.19218 Transcript_7151/m.19218 type:complete len:238 (-) Transcript_7151:87-800(-)